MRVLYRTSLLAILLIALPALAAEPVEIVNVMPAFWTFQQEYGPLSQDEAAQLFRTRIVDAHAQIYSKPEFKKNITNEGIALYLQAVQRDLSAMRRLSERIEPLTKAASERFIAMFPDLGPPVRVTYLPAFYRFDGQTTKIGGDTVILFGIDGIVRYHGERTNLGVLFSHELFHVYHARKSGTLMSNPDRTPVYGDVWLEGLATYVSGQLNPDARESELLLDETLLDRGLPMRATIAREILDRMDSIDRDDHRRFFAAGAHADIPDRSGYLIGYLIAKRLAAQRPLPKLASLDAKELEPMMRAELTRIATDCSRVARDAADKGPASRRQEAGCASNVPSPAAQ